jgi:hypothetical protein
VNLGRDALGCLSGMLGIFVIYSPLYSWLGFASTYSNYLSALKIKAANLDFTNASDTATYLFKNWIELTTNGQWPLQLDYWASSVSILLSFSLTAIVAEILAQIYGFDRARTYLASSIANIFNALPDAFGIFLQLLLVYAYLPKITVP